MSTIRNAAFRLRPIVIGLSVLPDIIAVTASWRWDTSTKIMCFYGNSIGNKWWILPLYLKYFGKSFKQTSHFIFYKKYIFTFYDVSTDAFVVVHVVKQL